MTDRQQNTALKVRLLVVLSLLSVSVLSLPTYSFAAPSVTLDLPAGIKTLPKGFVIPEGVTSLPDSLESLPDDLTSLPDSLLSLPKNLKSLPKNLQSLPKNLVSLPEGLTSLPDTLKSLPDTLKSLPRSLLSLPAGLISLPPGITSLPDGIKSLPDGLKNFASNLTSNLPSLPKIPSLSDLLESAGISIPGLPASLTSVTEFKECEDFAGTVPSASYKHVKNNVIETREKYWECIREGYDPPISLLPDNGRPARGGAAGGVTTMTMTGQATALNPRTQLSDKLVCPDLNFPNSYGTPGGFSSEGVVDCVQTTQGQPTPRAPAAPIPPINAEDMTEEDGECLLNNMFGFSFGSSAGLCLSAGTEFCGQEIGSTSLCIGGERGEETRPAPAGMPDGFNAYEGVELAYLGRSGRAQELPRNIIVIEGLFILPEGGMIRPPVEYREERGRPEEIPLTIEQAAATRIVPGSSVSVFQVAYGQYVAVYNTVNRVRDPINSTSEEDVYMDDPDYTGLPGSAGTASNVIFFEGGPGTMVSNNGTIFAAADNPYYTVEYPNDRPNNIPPADVAAGDTAWAALVKKRWEDSRD